MLFYSLSLYALTHFSQQFTFASDLAPLGGMPDSARGRGTVRDMDSLPRSIHSSGPIHPTAAPLLPLPFIHTCHDHKLVRERLVTPDLHGTFDLSLDRRDGTNDSKVASDSQLKVQAEG